MNRELIERLIDTLEKHPDRYAQGEFGVYGEAPHEWLIVSDCGTPGCIAGHVMVLEGLANPSEGDWFEIKEDQWLSDLYMGIEVEAGRRLGITEDQHHSLFRSAWPKDWLVKEEKPLPLQDPIRMFSCNTHEPTTEGAIHVLQRMLKHGFSHETHREYYEENDE